MVDLVMIVAAIATISAGLMVIGMLWFVWDAMEDDRHRLSGDDVD